jgi:polyphosphate:AMP phosphotransferase
MDRLITGEPVGKQEFGAAEPGLREALIRAQEDLAERDFPVLILLGGPDFTGCENVYELLHEWFDARYLRGEAFGAGTDVERARPWLWRYWRLLPPRGSVGVHLRGWATAAVSRRVLGEWDDERLEREIRHLRRLEEQLVADGALLLKFWLHVPKKVLKKRLQSAVEKDSWRIAAEEEKVHEVYDKARKIVERVLAGTDGPHAPWTVVDGSDRRFRDLSVARHIAGQLRARLDRPASTVRELPPERLRADPHTVLDQLDLGQELDGDAYDRRLDELRDRISDLHREAHARGIGAVFAFEGWDAAGKGGAIRRLTRAMDATKYKVFPVAAPNERERRQHWLWRFWHRLPRDGQIAVFDRSWYGRVLVERVEGFARRDEWERAYADIEDFEGQLVDHGYAVAKFFLHISADEQRRRFEQRQRVAYKRYKITPEDWRNRERWHDYEVAIDEMVARTSGAVRWQVVPANDKRHARIAVLEAVCRAYEGRLDGRRKK